MPALLPLLALAVLALPPAAAQAQAPQRAQPAVPTMPDAPIPPPVIPPASPPAAPQAAEAPTPPPTMPLAPPAPPVIPPPIAVPARPAPAPQPVEILAGAPGEATRLGEGWRITFGPGLSALSPATAQALREAARALPAQASATVSAYAPGSPEDPSVARRLSLARALAVRGVLIAEGIASPRIIVRALGASPTIADGPPDRVDLLPTLPSQARPAP